MLSSSVTSMKSSNNSDSISSYTEQEPVDHPSIAISFRSRLFLPLCTVFTNAGRHSSCSLVTVANVGELDLQESVNDGEPEGKRRLTKLLFLSLSLETSYHFLSFIALGPWWRRRRWWASLRGTRLCRITLSTCNSSSVFLHSTPLHLVSRVGKILPARFFKA